MTKRIVSGIFILTALGALGVILAGALTSGEQLIVRFLTAVIVAALGLYVISDLRLQADDDAVVARSSGSGRASPVDAPANSTAAFMATVTKRVDVQATTGETDLAPGHNEEHSGREHFLETATLGTSTEDRAFRPDKTIDLSIPRTELAGVSAGSQGIPRHDAFDDQYVSPADEDDGGRSELDEMGDHSPQHFSEEESKPFLLQPTKTSMEAEDPALDRFGIEAHDLSHDPLDTSATSQLPAVNDNVGLSVDEASSDETLDDDLIANKTFDDDVLGNSTLDGDVLDNQVPSDSQALSDNVNHEWPTPDAHLNPPTELHPDGPSEDQSEPAAANTNPVTHHQEAIGFSQFPIPARSTTTEIQAADYADAPLAPIIDLREVHSFQAAGSIDVAIKAGEVEVITTLIEQGMLSTDGPISDRDVRTMVYVAFTSNELRKLLLAGGSPDGPNDDLDLGPVELFDERVHTPAPKTLYTGLPTAHSQLG